MIINELFNVEKMKFINKYFEFIELEDIINKTYNNKYIVLDLRTKKEYDYKHLEDSIHLNIVDDDKAIQLEGMFENKTYFKTSIKSLLYVLPNLKYIKEQISLYEKDYIVVLACRHARIRSRCISMYVNILGCNTLVLKDGLNKKLKVDKKEILNL